MRAAASLLVFLVFGLAPSAMAQMNPQAAINESSVIAAPAASGPAPPAPPLVAPLPAPGPQFQVRASLQCADFKRALGGGWSALNAIQLPGPRGLVQIASGQIFGPGDYGSGFDVAAILEHDCSQAPPP